MLEDALSYPTKGDSGIARVLIGGGLLMFSWLLVPGFIAAGYLLRALGAASRGEGPPPFDDWSGMLVDGLKATVVSFVYGIVPFAVFGVLFVVVFGGAGAGGDAGGIVAGIGLLGVFVAIPFVFVVYYVVPAALTNVAREGSMSAAFDFETLKPVLSSGSYLTAVLLTFVVNLVGSAVLGFLSAFFVGLIVAPFYYFWFGLVGYYMFGEAFGEVAGRASSRTAAGASPTG
ncbi:DUF4013 domain-containing protein [Halobium palmae]|uniref:DUF4013 domain-containing protein n=1 Tax=Halobium palmae TaxID=1776492 RepID=A0ABD5S2G4_9EURY